MEVAGQGDLNGPHAGKMMEGLVPRKEGKNRQATKHHKIIEHQQHSLPARPGGHELCWGREGQVPTITAHGSVRDGLGDVEEDATLAGDGSDNHLP